MTTPVLVLIGEADEWNSAERCREVAARRRPDSAPIALSVYPGVHPAFDVAQLSPGIRAWGGWVEYNDPAAKDAEKKRRAFLSTLISPRHLRENQWQSDPIWAKRLLIAASSRGLSICWRRACARRCRSSNT